MSKRAQCVKLSLAAILASPVLVFATLFFENRALVLFPTHDDGMGNFTQCLGYGFPFAYREVVSLIDTHATHYHWGYFLLNTFLVAASIYVLLSLLARSKRFDIDEL